jgi:demethylmenaquinone methyltransferase / 2-methoxy-6-polyprenyl-1,4-benzoquinol methylase
VSGVPSKEPDRIASMFDAIAHRYDFLNHVLSGGLDHLWRRRAIRALQLRGCECVLDLCTGTGDLAIATLEARPSAARVIGVDFAAVMLRVAREKVLHRGREQCLVLVRGDATRLPLSSRSVDAVTIAFGIRNIERPERACAEMHRVLKVGGRLAMLEFAAPTLPIWRQCYGWYLKRVLPRIGRFVSGHQGAYSYLPASIDAFVPPDELVKILRHAGFVDVSSVRLTFGSVCLYVGRRGASLSPNF